MPEYAITLVFFFLLTLFIHTRYHLKIYKSHHQMFMVNLILVICATIWDQVAIIRGHWSFGQQFLLGPRLGHMPIEEFGFIIVMPYFAFTLFRYFEKNKQ